MEYKQSNKTISEFSKDKPFTPSSLHYCLKKLDRAIDQNPTSFIETNGDVYVFFNRNG
jgi:hypothetical protein